MDFNNLSIVIKTNTKTAIYKKLHKINKFALIIIIIMNLINSHVLKFTFSIHPCHIMIVFQSYKVL